MHIVIPCPQMLSCVKEARGVALRVIVQCALCMECSPLSAVCYPQKAVWSQKFANLDGLSLCKHGDEYYLICCLG